VRSDRCGDGLVDAATSDNVDDTTKDAESIAKKILSIRLFNDEANQHMWKRSVKDIDGEILCGSLTIDKC
jgi:D-Tyr-tRNAtyr deacylase